MTNRPLLWAGLILLITFVTYLPALHAGFVWDDRQNISENQSLRSLDGLKQIWVNPRASYQYYPLTYTTFWIEHHLWGLRPFGYHLLNILLHALNALLLGLLLRRLSVPGAWLAALIFAVHPVHVESVAWITERKNVLSGFFFLGSFLAYLRFVWGTEHRGRWYALALGLFLCALLGKTATAILPVAILLVLWWKRTRLRPADVSQLLPFVLLGAVLGRITLWVEVHNVGAQGAEWAMTFFQRVLIAGRAIWFYAKKLIWPHPLMFIYPRWQIDPSAWWQFLFPAVVMVLMAALLLFRKSIGKAPLVAVSFFVCAAAPVPAFIPLFFMHYSYVADHFQYLASMGLIALAAAGIARGLHSIAMRRMVGGLVVLILAVLSWQRCGAFYDEEALWRDTAAKNPDCWLAQEHLTDILFKQGKFDEAAAHNAELLRIRPEYGFAHNYRGVFLARQGKYDEAMAQFAEAVRDQPWNAFAHNYLGQALAMNGKIDEAVREFIEALRLDPNLAEAHNNLGLALATKGNSNAAIVQFREALRLEPNYPEADCNLGMALAQSGRLDEAAHYFSEALRLRPDFIEAHYNAAKAAAALGRSAEALRQYEEALRLQPDHLNALNNLAWLLATGNDPQFRHTEQAVLLAERAGALTAHHDPEVLDTLAAAYAATGKFDEAVRVAQQALGLATAAGQNALAGKIQERLDLYKAGRPFREPDPAAVP